MKILTHYKYLHLQSIISNNTVEDGIFALMDCNPAFSDTCAALGVGHKYVYLILSEFN